MQWTMRCRDARIVKFRSSRSKKWNGQEGKTRTEKKRTRSTRRSGPDRRELKSIRRSVMGIAFHCKGFLGLTCCLFVSSGLAAQVAGTKPRIAQNDLPPRTFVIPKYFPQPPIVL